MLVDFGYSEVCWLSDTGDSVGYSGESSWLSHMGQYIPTHGCDLVRRQDDSNDVPAFLFLGSEWRFVPDVYLLHFVKCSISGFNVSDYVTFQSCYASTERSIYGDKSYPGCEEAIDSIVCDKNNGLLWNETVPSWARFELEAPETLNTIMILNGVGKAGHKIKTFRLQVKTSTYPNSWQHMKEVTVKRDSGARVATNGTITLSSEQEHLQITFKPVKRVTRILIELIQTTGQHAIINEVLIPSEWQNDLLKK